MPRESDRFIMKDGEFSMVLEENRLRSFDDKWPFMENCVCTPQKMAEAGFFHCPTSQVPDGVRCFSCYKEMDSWEPEDDPWKEHRKHTIEKKIDCEFMKIGKMQSELTVDEFLKVVKARHVNLIKTLTEQKMTAVTEEAEKLREEMEKFGSGK